MDSNVYIQSKQILFLDGQHVEQVRQFKYLGSLITADGYPIKDIQARTAVCKTVFMDKRNCRRAS